MTRNLIPGDRHIIGGRDLVVSPGRRDFTVIEGDGEGPEQPVRNDRRGGIAASLQRSWDKTAAEKERQRQEEAQRRESHKRANDSLRAAIQSRRNS